MERREFEAIVRDTYNSLPKKFLKALENLEIIVEARPSRRYGKGMLLGLYEGVPLPRRGWGYSMALPDRITLFQRNIERISGGADDEIRRQIRKTLIHEIGHYFGMNEEEVRKAMGD